MNSILKSTTLALLAVSTAAAIGCGRNSQPNRYPDNRYPGYPAGQGGTPFNNGPVGGPVGPGGAPVGPGEVGGPVAPGGPVGPGGVGAPVGPGGMEQGGPNGQGGDGQENSQGDWHSWNCSTQNADTYVQTCVSNAKNSDHSDNVISALNEVQDDNTNFPVYVLWSKSLARKLQLAPKERLCLKSKLCSADIGELNYSSSEKPKFDPTSDFNNNQNGQQGQQGQQGQNLPQRNPNQNSGQQYQGQQYQGQQQQQQYQQQGQQQYQQ